MFKKPARSIQAFASIFLFLGVIAGIGLIYLGANSKENSIEIIIAGIITMLCSIVISLFMQAFGVLCERVDQISEDTAKATTLLFNKYTVVYNDHQNEQTSYDNNTLEYDNDVHRYRGKNGEWVYDNQDIEQ